MSPTKKSNKVLHIMSGYGGGISSFIRNKAEILKERSIPFDVATFDEVSDSFNSLIEQTGGKVLKISNPKEKGFKLFYKQVNQIMKRQPKNVLIHSHVSGVKALPFYLIARKNGLKRFVIHAHTAAPPEGHTKIQRELTKNINRMLSKEKLSCGQEASKNIFGRKLTGQKKIVHIPNSINEKNFIIEKNSSQLKKEILGISDDRLVVGSIGRFRKVKNHYFMIKVIEELKKDNIPFLWFFAGDGLMKEEVESLVKEKKLEQYVKFLGRREDIPNLFKIMDVFVLPSFYEGLPTVVIEAQASSTYSIVSDTVTMECDIGLDLVRFLSISNERIWAEELRKIHPIKKEQEDIIQQLIKKKFTNETSAQLYEKFLDGELSYYNI